MGHLLPSLHSKLSKCAVWLLFSKDRDVYSIKLNHYTSIILTSLGHEEESIQSLGSIIKQYALFSCIHTHTAYPLQKKLKYLIFLSKVAPDFLPHRPKQSWFFQLLLPLFFESKDNFKILKKYWAKWSWIRFFPSEEYTVINVGASLRRS